jgi:hypothetical protein
MKAKFVYELRIKQEIFPILCDFFRQQLDVVCPPVYLREIL